jgi:hypothetical protein
MSTCISTETVHEAQVITAEIWQSASCAEIMLLMLSESRLFQNSTHYMPQLYLFAASCARNVNHLLHDARSQEAVCAAELFATDSTTKTHLLNSHRDAQAAVIDLAKNAPFISTGAPNPDPFTTRQTFFAGALLHAAAAASMASTPSHLTAPVQAAQTSARYAINALYYEQLSYDSDSTLISQVFDEEQHRQSQSLRIFLGNPFDPKRWPPFTIPEITSPLKEPSRYQFKD